MRYHRVMHRIAFIRSVTLALAASLCLIAAPPEQHARKIDDYITAWQKLDRFEGSALVAEKGKVIYRKGFGLANREWNIANGPDTIFRLGSVTKQFTSALVLQLAEQGKLKLDAKIRDYIPEYPAKQGDRVTVHHLLSHTSGIPNYTQAVFMQTRVRDRFAPFDLAREFWAKDLEFDPGAKFAYSNSGYHVLGMIIERVAGKSYEKLLHERILDPLGMKDSGYDHNAQLLKRRAAGYRQGATGVENCAYLDMSIPYSAGALYSTVEDLYLWDQALYTEKVLSGKSRDLMFKPNLSDYAYGWFVGPLTLPGGRKLARTGHGGGIFGFNTLITRFTDDRQLVVLLSNVEGVGRYLGPISDGIAAILYDEEPKPPQAAEKK